jgi:hypothetical protein
LILLIQRTHAHPFSAGPTVVRVPGLYLVEVFVHQLPIAQLHSTSQLDAFLGSVQRALLAIAGVDSRATLVNMSVVPASSGVVALDIFFSDERAAAALRAALSTMRVVYAGDVYSVFSEDVSPTPIPNAPDASNVVAIVLGVAGGVACLVGLGVLVGRKRAKQLDEPTLVSAIALVAMTIFFF